MNESSEFDPYAPPRANVVDPIQLPADQWAGLELRVAEVNRTWTTCELGLAGVSTSVIRYESMGWGESIFVDGVFAKRASVWKCGWNLLNAVNDRVEFELPCGDYGLPVVIEPYVSMFQLLRLTRFRVTVCGRLIFDDWSAVQ